jgi:chromosome segregation ATPase
METYRKETEAKIAANNESIAAFNARIDSKKAEAKTDYKNRIAELENKNTDMKKRLDEYKADGKDNWEIFKLEFSRDMEELGKAFKDLTVTNTK